MDLDARDEIDCLVKGMAFLMAHVAGEAFTWVGDVPVDRMGGGMVYPYLLVNVGSGAGFILVRSEESWERVSGTSIGGGTFYGLCHMLTGEASYERMLDGAEGGANDRVDLTVGDIYGGDYGKFHLKAGTIAASFGKALMCAPRADAPPSPQLHGQGARSGGGGGGGGGESPQKLGGEAEEEVEVVGAASPDGSFRSIGRQQRLITRRREATELPVESAPGFAKPLHTRSWDPATLLAAVAAGEGIGGEGGEGLAGLPLPAARERAASERHSMGVGGSAEGSGSGSVGAGGEGEDGAPEVGAGEEGGEGGPTGAAPPPYWQPRDAYRALLIMISNNLGQLAYLNALRYNCKHVYFAGNFLRVENTIAMRTLSYAISFWSKGTMEGLFLRHEGYCGALGAFLSTLEGSGGVGGGGGGEGGGAEGAPK